MKTQPLVDATPRRGMSLHAAPASFPFQTNERRGAALRRDATWRRVYLTLALLAVASTARACPVCFAAPDSAETRGMTLAILFLLGTVGIVICGIASFFIYLVAKQKEPLPGHAAQLDESPAEISEPEHVAL